MTTVKAFIIAVFAAATIPVAAEAQNRGRLAACKDDIQKFCANEPKGQGKIKACLQSNSDKVSPDCKAALDAAK